MTNAADPKAIKARTRREKREEQRRVARIRAAWGTPQSREYLWDLMAFAGFLKNPMTGNAWTEFNCGAMNVAQRMFADVESACPELFMLARSESKKYQKSEDDAEAAELAPPEPPEKEDLDG